jgi:oxygen-independent coproporphyrinogen III oxidase
MPAIIGSMDIPLSLYLHIPFCRHRCSYCDFNTYTSLGELRLAYGRALAQEVAQVGRLAEAARVIRPLHTIFFGGGTPSLMPLQSLAQVLTAVSTHFGITTNAEISLEANPGTVDLAYLKGLRRLGVNRLSFGVQSVIDSELALLEREHDFDAVVEAIALARQAGFENFNLDLIYGLPGQTLTSWEQSVRTVLTLDPTHMSLYCLTIEPGTPMKRWLHNGRIQPPDPDLAADQYELAGEMLGRQGFSHYEISNWARPGQECRHNLAYWRNEAYLGLGAGAHGQAGGYRYAVVKQPRVYLRRLAGKPSTIYPLSAAVAESHLVDDAEAMSDTVITQLRLLQEGLDLRAFAQRFGRSLTEAYGATVTNLLDWGLLHQENERLLLTKNGRFLSNQVFYRFM